MFPFRDLNHLIDSTAVLKRERNKNAIFPTGSWRPYVPRLFGEEGKLTFTYSSTIQRDLQRAIDEVENCKTYLEEEFCPYIDLDSGNLGFPTEPDVRR